MKIFKHFRFTQSLRIMFQTFIHTLPAMGSIGGLLALLIYVYAVLGVSIFAEVKRVEPFTGVMNFDSFGFAYLILVKIMTGDGWAELLGDLSKRNQATFQCNNSPTYA